MIGDLKGVKLMIAINQIQPFLTYGSESNKLTGFESNLVYVLSKSLNFTFEILDLQDNWSRLLPNNTWLGIIGKIIEKVSHLFQIEKNRHANFFTRQLI